MGLLDGLMNRDMIFALGLLDAGSPKPVRTNIGAGLLSALGQAQQFEQAQEDRRAAAEDRKQRGLMQAMQMDQLRMQMAEAQRAAAERQAASARQSQFLSRPFVNQPSGAPSFMTGSGSRSPEANAEAQAGAYTPQFDYAGAVAAFGPEAAAKIMEGMKGARNFGADKVVRYETVAGPNNQPMIQGFDDFGRKVGAPIPKPVEMSLEDLGGKKVAVNKYSLTPGASMDKTMTPDAVASNKLGWANYGLGRERLQFDKENPTLQFDSDRGTFFNPRTGAVTSATMNGAPVGPKDKPIAEAGQKQIIGARNLQDAIGGYLEELKTWSNAAMLSPDRRARMGNIYNNMMLQAKEAYNLGVLNGPDYDILQKVVADPTNAKSAMISNEGLANQAKSLQSIAANIERTALQAHGKPYTPRVQTVDLFPQDKSGGGLKFLGWEEAK